MSRALKIHHRERIKKSRRFHWGDDLLNNPERLAKTVNTPKPCSCFMCGNARRYAGKTRQERRSDDAMNSYE